MGRRPGSTAVPRWKPSFASEWELDVTAVFLPIQQPLENILFARILLSSYIPINRTFLAFASKYIYITYPYDCGIGFDDAL